MHVDPAILENAAASAKSHLEEGFRGLSEDGLSDILDDRILKWMLESQLQMEEKFPYSRQQFDYENCRADLLKNRTTAESLCQDVLKCEAIGAQAKIAWSEEIARPGADIADLQKRLLSIWKDHIDKITAEWNMRIIEKRRGEFVDSMEKWLRFIESAKKTLGIMGLGNGLLWDLSMDRDDHEDHSALLTWAERFRNDPALRKLCEQLGHEMMSSRSSQVQMEVPQSSEQRIVDRTVSEEFSGIESGHRIEDLLPSELGSIDDPDLGILFELKFAEDRLTCFSKQGYTSVESETVVTANVEKADDGFAGPVILCIDTSGSMTGTPEYIAKGIVLYLAMLAHSEKRRCYLINFSTSIETLDLSPSRGMTPLLEFMEKSFHGGTDMKPALIHAIEKLNDGEYRKADILAVSDFIMPPDDLGFLQEEVGESKDRKCRFHSLTIGEFPFTPVLNEIFDVSWKFKPATHSIVRL